MNDTPLFPAPLFGLRTWRLAVDDDGEHLTGVWERMPWPTDGVWMEAQCAKASAHPAPHAACSCGVHAWHPRRSSARRVLAKRYEVPGVVAAAGSIELQHDGFRSALAKPYALFVTPGRNLGLVKRLARRYGAEVVAVRNADALLAWCRDRGLGLTEAEVLTLLGPEHTERRRHLRRRELRRGVLGVAAVAVLSAGLVLGGASFLSAPPTHRVFGRTGWVTPPGCVQREVRAGGPHRGVSKPAPVKAPNRSC